jgi:hypothetical protein
MPSELQSNIENKIICVCWGLMGGGGMDGMSGLLCIGKHVYIHTLYLLLRIVSITIPPRIKFPGRSSGIPEDKFQQTFSFLRVTLKARLCWLVGLCHFSLVIVAVLMGMAPRWRLVSFFLPLRMRFSF